MRMQAVFNGTVVADSDDTVVVEGVGGPNAAWHYPHPSFLARRIKGRVAFWNGVEVRAVHEDQTPNVTSRRPPPGRERSRSR